MAPELPSIDFKNCVFFYPNNGQQKPPKAPKKNGIRKSQNTYQCIAVKFKFPPKRALTFDFVSVPDEFVKLHVTLLKKLHYRSFASEKWERYLIKECSIYSSDDSSELEAVGYKNTSVPLRLRLLKVHFVIKNLIIIFKITKILTFTNFID